MLRKHQFLFPTLIYGTFAKLRHTEILSSSVLPVRSVLLWKWSEIKNNKPKQSFFNPLSTKIKGSLPLDARFLSPVDTKRWEKLYCCFFPLKYPNLLRNLQLWLPPASLLSLTPQFIKSYPFPQHPYFGLPCLHNLNLPIAKGTFCLFKKKKEKPIHPGYPFIL